MVPAWFSKAMATKRPPLEHDKLKAGMYDVVRSLLRALEQVRQGGEGEGGEGMGGGSLMRAVEQVGGGRGCNLMIALGRVG